MSKTGIKRGKMTKKDLAARIAAELGLSQLPVAAAIQKTLDYISAELAEGRTVELRDFGVFGVCVRKSRPGRNPKSPEDKVVIPERVAVKFKVGKALAERVGRIRRAKVKK
ncbi:MAG: HU family DNA-binding protein [Lentisphaerota bacterium]